MMQLYPKEWKGPIIFSLESYFMPYIKQANPKAGIFIIPDPMADWPPSAFWDDETDNATLIMLPEEELADEPLTDADKRQILAVLAHEAAHAEPYPPVSEYKTLKDVPSVEVEAFVRGVMWASKWRVLKEYDELFNTRGVVYLTSFLGNPSYEYSENVLQGDIAAVRWHIRNAGGATG